MKGIESNPETFESLINSMRVKLYKTAMAILKNDDDACDAIQKNINPDMFSMAQSKYYARKANQDVQQPKLFDV